MFSIGGIADPNTHHDSGRDRVESRICDVIDDLKFMDEKEKWKGLKSIVRVQSEHYIKQTRETLIHNRYYTNSLSGNVEKINKAVQRYRSVENNLHWELDVIFNEGNSLKKNGNSPKTFNVILKMAMTLFKK